jgi:CPA2 family monovalent cation:H+ antiporter-2
VPTVPDADPAHHLAPPMRDHVVLIGYGRVGRVVGRDLARTGAPFLVIDQNGDVVQRLRKKGVTVLAGDASIAGLLAQASLAQARGMVIAIPNANEARRVFDLAKAFNPALDVIVRAHSEDDLEYYRTHGAREALIAENELGHSLSRATVRDEPT